MKHIYNDGGRSAAGYSGKAGDCACRALAIAAGIPYQQAYDLINQFASRERKGTRKRGMSNARTGVHSATMRRVMDSLGWKWTATMGIGTGCKVHLRDNELPAGRLVVLVSRHFTAVIDGVIHDTHDPQRLGVECADADKADINGTRCVYGYWSKAPRN